MAKKQDISEEDKRLKSFLKKNNISSLEAITALNSAKKIPIKQPRLNISGKSFQYMYLSDTHIGHKAFKENLFDKFLRVAKKEKPDFVVHPGDHLEGMSGRPGHIYELTHLGFTNQIDYAKQLYDQIPVPIYGIDGNHDQWYEKKNNGGIIVGKHLENMVENYTNLGPDEGTIDVNGIKIYLYHGGDGTAYADCVDDKTEILTENGWKLFKDLDKTEKVATLNQKDNLFEWQKPTKYTDEFYEGEMLNFKSRTFDLVVTPNHRMLVRRYPNNILQGRKDNLKYPTKSHRKINFDWKIKHAKELENVKRQEWQMTRGGQSWKGELKNILNFKIEDLAELVAWYVTEGYIRKSCVSIAQYERINPENYYKIIDLFKRMNLNPREEKRKQHINIYNKEVADYLIKSCGHKSRNKFIPKILKNQPKEILQIIFDTMIAGDGWISPTGYGYKSISKQLLDDFSEVCHKLGYATTKYGDSLSISNIQITPTINSKPDKLNYSGRIYCVSVPNKIILVRRNGKAIWTGNSYKIQKLIESFTSGDKPNIIHSGHYHKALNLFSRNIHGFESGTLMGQSRWMRGKKIRAHLGFGLVKVNYNNKGVDSLTHTFYPGYEEKEKPLKI